MTSRTTQAVTALTAYIAAIVAANWLTTRYGLVLHDENGQPFEPDGHDCGEAPQ